MYACNANNTAFAFYDECQVSDNTCNAFRLAYILADTALLTAMNVIVLSGSDNTTNLTTIALGAAKRLGAAAPSMLHNAYFKQIIDCGKYSCVRTTLSQ